MMDARRPRAAAATPEASALRAKAPTLAWLLTALACFLTGWALGEGRYYVAAPLAPPPS